MKKYGIIPSLLGSDQLIMLDGRWNRNSVINHCKEHIDKLKKIHPNNPMDKVHICSGKLSNPTILYTINMK